MLKALLSFGTLITPSIVRFLFYIGVLLSCLAALLDLGAGLSMLGTPYLGSLAKLAGLVVIVLAPVVALIGIVLSRVAAELVLIPFMIRDELAWQRQHRDTRLQAAAE